MSDFWTRRKSAVQAEERAQEAALAEADAQARETELAERPDEELLAEAGMPDPDMLADGEQVRAFMQSALPDRLKTRALRRLWRLDPVLANVDGLVDYGGDFTDAANVVENLQTTYQVGKGMLRAIQARAAEAEQEREEEGDVAAAEVPDQVRDGLAVLPASDDEAQPVVSADPASASEPGPCIDVAGSYETEQAAPTARRMVFSFKENATSPRKQ
ncbi:DUF3306 domain-containing protein [Primorskyibacter flagellatus]|uniref:DUF3306 domain-containing protein n=1 Tax=Primorskyibacter flagellatus TaxID=1387277 RepID=A0A1W2ALS1_9RHOB|nr:DUF3306 domain-containing protein [Primorskyibacter flagellatus]SMC61462.1 Protein of unknown function [Primorskyibacter flagellatus]